MSQPQNRKDPDTHPDQHHSIIAYCINRDLAVPIVPATPTREWMDDTPDRFAYRCLPLLIANQAGWFLLNDQRISIIWSGEPAAASLVVRATDGSKPKLCSSHFGNGVITWDVPYLFRTPPGYDLLVRGPANWPKDGVFPLEGLIETDWLDATFSINWKVLRPNYEIIFEPGEPIAMIVPQRRGELEAFRPGIVDLSSDHERDRDYSAWETERRDFLKKLRKGDNLAEQQGWHKKYFHGIKNTGEHFDDHQTKLNLERFKDSGTESD